MFSVMAKMPNSSASPASRYQLRLETLFRQRENTMVKTLRVGLIGASAERGWAKISHVPAIQQLGGLELAAVVTQDRPSANKAARMFGAAKGYDDAKQLFADPEIDIVTVAVNVPAHRDLVLGALAAGKHLYCEYPWLC